MKTTTQQLQPTPIPDSVYSIDIPASVIILVLICVLIIAVVTPRRSRVTWKVKEMSFKASPNKDVEIDMD